MTIVLYFLMAAGKMYYFKPSETAEVLRLAQPKDVVLAVECEKVEGAFFANPRKEINLLNADNCRMVPLAVEVLPPQRRLVAMPQPSAAKAETPTPAKAKK